LAQANLAAGSADLAKMAAAAEDRHAQRRTQILTESLETSNEPRWGYFGLAGSLAIGDNSFAPELTRRSPQEDDAGEPIRNIGTCPLKKGSGPDVYFQFETPLAIGDPYTDPLVMQRKGRVQMLDPEAAFRPPGKVKHSINKLGYEYQDHKDSYKDPKEVYAQRKDYMPPRQIYTNAAKKGGGGVLTKGVLFGLSEERLFPEYVPDDYDAARKHRLKEIEEHNAKCPEVPFKSNDYGNRPFQHSTETYHYDIPTHIPRDPRASRRSSASAPRVQHEQKFRPSNPQKKGFREACFSLPEYMEDPVPGGASRRPPLEGDPPQPYRLGAPRQVCNPTPSVVTLTRNMRNERPSSFARPSL